MSTKIFNTRLQLKYDSWKNWYDNNPTLLAGEIAIVNVPAQTDESTGEVTQKPAILFKVGDGTTDFRTLDWASGLAADVYGWAKAENKPEYIASEITVSDESGYFGNNSVEGVLKEIWETVAEMTGGSGSVGSIASQIANGIAALGSASVTGDKKYVTGVKVVDGKLAIEEAELPDYSNTYAAKSLEKTVEDHITAVADYDARITAAQTKANEVAQAATDANANAETRVKTSDFEAFKTDNTAAIQEAANAGTTAAAGVQSNLDAYEATNDAALAEVRAIADAARTEAEVNTQIDAKITALDLANKYEAIGAEDRAKEYVDGKFTKANLDQYTTEQEVKDIVDGVIAGAADSETYNSLTKLVDYIDKHGGDAANMAEAIETLEGQVEVIEGKPAYNITSTQISNWDNEVGAKALAETKTTTAEVKSQIEAYGYATTGYADEKASAAEDNAKGYADNLIAGLDGNATATAEADGKVSVLTEIAQVDGVISKASEVTLEKVAKTGKLGDLVEDTVANKDTTDYVVFYCGTSEILTK